MVVDSDAEVAAARIGRVIGGRFRLERVLGIGGMAAVYAARDATGQEVAVKLLHPEMAARREVRERFVREASVSDTIGHPGVVRTLPSGGGNDAEFLVMELLRGETLRARVKRHGKRGIWCAAGRACWKAALYQANWQTALNVARMRRFTS